MRCCAACVLGAAGLGYNRPMKHFLLCCFLLFSLPFAAAVADEKTEAMDNLLRAYGADKGELSGLLDVRNAINDALFSAAVGAVDGGDFPVWGDASGALVVEFSDYQCGYCKRMFPPLQNAVQDGDARVLVIEWPILGPLSERAARRALAAKAQGRYDEFHQLLMLGERLSEESLDAATVAAGLDMEQLQKDENSPAIDAALDRNFQLARLLGVEATPTLIINGALVRGAVQEDELRRLLASAGK